MSSLVDELQQKLHQLQVSVHSIPRSEKKRRKRVNAEIAALQQELQRARYGREDAVESYDEDALLAALVTSTPPPVPVNGNGEPQVEAEKHTKGKKASRQKARIARKATALADAQTSAQDEAKNMVDHRANELSKVQDKVEAAGLCVKEIAPDGHCLFAAIADQLSVRTGTAASVQELRQLAAEHIRQHSEDFLPFLMDEVGNVPDIDQYCTEMQGTSVWGGDAEIMAIAKTKDLSVAVWQAEAAPLVFNRDGKHQIKIAFYQKFYALGEHYNSLREVSSLKGREE